MSGVRLLPLVLFGVGVGGFALAQSAAPRAGVSSSAVAPIVEAYIADAGVLPGADKDVPAHTFIANNAQDGYAFRALNDGRFDFGSGTSDEIYSDGNGITATSTWNMQTLFASQFACPANTTCRHYSDLWAGYYPIAAMPTCDGTAAGGLMVYNASNSLKYCDGSSTWNVGMVLSSGDVVDFAGVTEGQEISATMTVTGAATGKPVHCNPVAAIEPGLVVSYSYVSAANTVTITIMNLNAGSGIIDPASATYVCVVTR